MKRSKIGAWTIGALVVVLTVAVLLDITGGRLAQPERTGTKDRLIGFHLVPERVTTIVEEDGSEWGQVGDNDRTHWVEYGAEDMEVEGFGKLNFPRYILKGVYNEEKRRYDFPGKEGYNCFLAIRTGEDGTNYINGYTDMSHVSLEQKVTDAGEENILNAALYVGTIQEGEYYDWVLTAYRVYQMEDGTVYLDGTGSSYGGAGFTVNERSEYTTTVNGESTTEILEIEFSLKDAEELTQVEVTWFDAGDQPMEVRILAPEEIGTGLELPAPEGAAWAMVKETDEHGCVERAAYDLGEGPARHELILLDDRGIGRSTALVLTAGQRQ